MAKTFKTGSQGPVAAFSVTAMDGSHERGYVMSFDNCNDKNLNPKNQISTIYRRCLFKKLGDRVIEKPMETLDISGS